MGLGVQRGCLGDDRRRPGPVVGEQPVVSPRARGRGRGDDGFGQHVGHAEGVPGGQRMIVWQAGDEALGGKLDWH